MIRDQQGQKKGEAPRPVERGKVLVYRRPSTENNPQNFREKRSPYSGSEFSDFFTSIADPNHTTHDETKRRRIIKKKKETLKKGKKQNDRRRRPHTDDGIGKQETKPRLREK